MHKGMEIQFDSNVPLYHRFSFVLFVYYDNELNCSSPVYKTKSYSHDSSFLEYTFDHIQSHICTYLLFTILCCLMHIKQYSLELLWKHWRNERIQRVFTCMVTLSLSLNSNLYSKIETDLCSFVKRLFNNDVISNFVKTQT